MAAKVSKIQNKTTTQSSKKAKVVAKVDRAKPKAQSKLTSAKPVKSTILKKGAPVKKAVALAKKSPPSRKAPLKSKADKTKKNTASKVTSSKKEMKTTPDAELHSKAKIKNHLKAKETDLNSSVSATPAVESKNNTKINNKKTLVNTQAVLNESVVRPTPVARPLSASMTKAQARRAAAQAALDALCRESGCENLSTTAHYCRLHYIKNWKKVKRKELILKERKLNQYIEELIAKYPDKYIDAIRQDLANDKDFAKVIRDLDLDETMDDFENEAEAIEGVIDTIKRDFDDDADF